MNKYEQLIEHIINDDESKARALFHSIVVERSREIYESLMDQEQHGMSHDAVGGLVDEISMDEEGMHEDDEEVGMPGDDMGGEPGDEAGMDMDPMGGDMGGDDMGGMDSDSGAPATKSDIMDLESAIDELKAEFDRLMSDEAGGEEDFGGEEGEEEGGEAGGDNPFAGADDEESDDEESADDEEEESVAESRVKRDQRMMSEAERLREYVDKVGHDWDKNAQKGPKGDNVGTGDKSERQGERNTKSIIDNMKNDMGGTNANMNRQSNEADPNGQTPKGKAGGFLKPAQEIDVAKRNVNKPGGNKGAENYYNGKTSAKKSGEEGGTNTNSPLNGAPGRAK
jgi:hypothetical protein